MRPAVLQKAPQGAVASVDAVAGHPGTRHAGVQGALQHLDAQLGLGGEGDLLGDPGDPTALLVTSPCFGQVQRTVEQSVAMAAGIAEKDADLTVFNASGSTRILALHADGMLPFLDEASLVKCHHRVHIAQVLDDIDTQIVAHRIGIPAHAGQKVLHAVGRGIARRLGKVPTVLALQRRHKTAQVAAGALACLNPAKARRDPLRQFVQASCPVLCRFHACHSRHPCCMTDSTAIQNKNPGCSTRAVSDQVA